MVVAGGDVLEIKVACRTVTQLGLNVRHYVVTDATGDPVELQFLADVMSERLAPLYKANLGIDATFWGVQMQKIHPLPAGTPRSSGVSRGVGLVDSPLLPEQVSGVLTLRTDLAGRSNRGRAYIPFPTEGDNDDEVRRPSATYVTNLQALATFLSEDQWIQQMDGSVVLEPVIWRRLPRTHRTIQTGVARDLWATQRRRGNYGAANLQPPW